MTENPSRRDLDKRINLPGGFRRIRLCLCLQPHAVRLPVHELRLHDRRLHDGSRLGLQYVHELRLHDRRSVPHEFWLPYFYLLFWLFVFYLMPSASHCK